MIIRVHGFRGCERAEIEPAPLALVGGRNASGKSSLAQAAAAVLGGKTMPLDLARGQVRLSIAAGHQAAGAEITGERGSARIELCGARCTADLAGRTRRR